MMRIPTLLTLLLLAVAVHATDYDALWKKVEASRRRDMPKQTVTLLDNIIAHATAEGEAGEYMAASFCRGVALEMVSPDSLQTAFDTLCKQAREAERKSLADNATDEDVAIMALYYTALARWTENVETTLTKEECLDKALRSPEVLARNVTMPFRRMVSVGKDDVAYCHDLLSFVGHEAKRYTMLYDYYLAHGNRRAACLELFLHATQSSFSHDDLAVTHRKTMLAEGMTRFADLPEASLLAKAYYDILLSDNDVTEKVRHTFLMERIAYHESLWGKEKEEYVNALRNALTEITRPTFSVVMDRGTAVVEMRNISTMNIELFPLDADGKYQESSVTNRNIAAIKKKISGEAIKVRKVYDMPEWQQHADTLKMPEMPYGVYLVKLTGDKLTAYSLYYHSDLSLLILPLSKDTWRIITVSATTGEPVPDATVVFSKEDGRGNVKAMHSFVTDKKGETTVRGMEEVNRVYVYTPHDKAFKKTYHSAFFSRQKRIERRDVAHLFTDRAIYRPGQDIKATVIVHNAADEENIHVVEGKRMAVEIYDAKGETVFADSITTDGMGNAMLSYALPEKVNNGMWRMTCREDSMLSAYVSFRVEEYRRPTFEVRCSNAEDFRNVIAIMRDTCRAADTLRVAVSFDAVRFTEQPVAKAQVTYSVRRSSLWPWWRMRGDSRTVIDKAVAETGADGTVTLPLTLTIPEGSSGGYVFHVTAEVTDANGETQEAMQTIRVTRKDDGVRYEGRTALPEYEVSHEAFTPSGSVRFVMRKRDAAMQSAYYTLFSDKGIVESGTLRFDTLYTRNFSYSRKYGEGLTLAYTWVRDGKAHSFSTTLRKPSKDLRLPTVWKTFRDRTMPGKEETWTISVGRGQKATMLATVYDSSLDALSPLSWTLTPIVNTYWLSTSFNGKMPQTAYGNAWQETKARKVYDVETATINSAMVCMPVYSFGIAAPSPMYGMAGSMKNRTAKMALDMAVKKETVIAEAVEEKAMAEGEERGDGDGMNGNEADISRMLRTSLGETAYYVSSATADEQGNISLTFRMPETMTAWRLKGIVYDTAMRHAMVDTLCVAQKDIVVRPNIPRFLREGDRAVVRAAVENTTEKDITAEVTMQYLDGAGKNVIWQEKRELTVKAKEAETIAMRAMAVPEDSAVVIRIVACTPEGASDGEQHMVYVEPKTESVTMTRPFTLHASGEYEYDIANLIVPGSTGRMMRVKYTGRAEDLLLDAVSSASVPSTDDALALVSALYVRRMFSMTDTLDISGRLMCMQDSDGMWPWWNGMSASSYVTTGVARMLARLALFERDDSNVRAMLSKAMPALLTLLNDEASELRKTKKKENVRPSQTALDIMYIVSVMKHTGRLPLTSQQEKDMEYMVSLMENTMKGLSIYGKANGAVILAMNGRKAKAKQFMESLREYSVVTEEAGRYFDSPKALYSWRNYRIPSQVAAIEALWLVEPQDVTTREEMQRWLLHEKRTQLWSSSVNTADAIHAFMLARGKDDGATEPAVIRYNGTTLHMEGGKTLHAEREIGEGGKLSVSKTSQGTSWGAVYVDQDVDAESVSERGEGFTIYREVIDDGQALGRRVKVRITVKAFRDYDFVEIHDNRMACLEPVEQLSRYCRAETYGTARGSFSGYYRVVGDRRTSYFFDKMAKGTHVIETEYHVDREGEYSQGTVTVRCSYADEFSAIAR